MEEGNLIDLGDGSQPEPRPVPDSHPQPEPQPRPQQSRQPLWRQYGNQLILSFRLFRHIIGSKFRPVMLVTVQRSILMGRIWNLANRNKFTESSSSSWEKCRLRWTAAGREVSAACCDWQLATKLSQGVTGNLPDVIFINLIRTVSIETHYVHRSISYILECTGTLTGGRRKLREYFIYSAFQPHNERGAALSCTCTFTKSQTAS